tara:strand:- start:433 stop:717 length:285 start_codon:yes stop_codon:yes gene_type:complete
MMTHQEMIDVITHHMNGGKVESLVKHNPSDEWGIVSTPIWNFSECYYRAKPEPLVLWAVYDSIGLLTTYAKQEVAETTARFMVGTTVKKFIEEI